MVPSVVARSAIAETMSWNLAAIGEQDRASIRSGYAAFCSPPLGFGTRSCLARCVRGRSYSWPDSAFGGAALGASSRGLSIASDSSTPNEPLHDDRRQLFGRLLQEADKVIERVKHGDMLDPISFGMAQPMPSMEIVCSKTSRFCGQPHLSTRTLGEEPSLTVS